MATETDTRTDARQAPQDGTVPRGILDTAGALPYVLQRVAPAPTLAWCVEHHWTSRWDIPVGSTYDARVLSFPSVNMTFFDRALHVTGVSDRVFVQPLTGTDRVLGTKFRPGGFRPFLGRDATELTGRRVPATELWPRSAVSALELAAGSTDFDGWQLLAEDFLRDRAPDDDPLVAEVDRLVQLLLADPLVSSVGDVVARTGWTPRALQRLFRAYVGVPPRWVLKRGRLHLAAQWIADDVRDGAEPNWAGLAADLGWSDQPHFIRDFRRVVGATPARYARSLRTTRSTSERRASGSARRPGS